MVKGRPVLASQAAASAVAASEWPCGKCRMLNFAARTTCRSCSAPRPLVVAGSPTIGHVAPAVAPPGEPQVGDAADGIQRVDRQLAEVTDEMAHLWQRRAIEQARLDSFLAPEKLVARIAKENRARVAVKEENDDVEVSASHPVEPSEYDLFRETASRAKENRALYHRVIRERKMVTYHRMRMTGRRMMGEVEANTFLLDDGTLDESVLLPGAVFRLATWANNDRHEGTERWDASLAPEVPMVWNRDPLNHVYDDQTQRVQDPYAEHAARRQMLKWTDEEQTAFVEAYKDYGKEFHVVATKKPFRVSEVAPKTTNEIIAFYYHIKHRIGLKELVSRRGARMMSLSNGASNIPKELRDMGINTEKDFLAYLVAKNRGEEIAAAESQQRKQQEQQQQQQAEKRPRGGAEEGAEEEAVLLANTEWSGLEAAILEESLREHGRAWETVAQDTGKSAQQVEAFVKSQPDRFKDALDSPVSLDDGMSLSDWTESQRTTCRQLIRNRGTDWEAVAQGLPGKNAEQCKALFDRFRWRLGLQEALNRWDADHQTQRPNKSQKTSEPPVQIVVRPVKAPDPFAHLFAATLEVRSSQKTQPVSKIENVPESSVSGLESSNDNAVEAEDVKKE